MGTDALHYKVGGVQYPLASGTGNSLLRDADPPLYVLLDYLSAMVTTHVGTRLLAEATAISAPIASAVAEQLPYDPGPYLSAATTKFPLLAVYRRKAKYDMQTITQWHREAEFGITYVLPPLSAAQAENILPILRAVSDVVTSAIEIGSYPTYTPPGSTAGTSAMQLAGLAKAAILEESYGLFPKTDDLVFPAWTGVISVHEQRAVVTGYDAMGAVDITEDLTNGADQTTVAAFVQDKTDVSEPSGGYSGKPVIASVTPATGPAAGGTSVTLKGDNFFAGLAVSFDGVAATSVVVVDRYTVTCATPARSAGAGVVVVAVVNANGTVGFSDQGFTYT